MNDYLALLIISTLSIGLVLQELRYRRLKSLLRQKDEQIEAQTEAFARLINSFNHEGPIPDAATLLGLTKLILSALSRCIFSFQEKLDAKDWNISKPLEELYMITTNEIRYMTKKVGELLDSRHEILKYFENFQDKSKADTWSKLINIPTDTDSSSSAAST